jgi:hypothetical protein
MRITNTLQETGMEGETMCKNISEDFGEDWNGGNERQNQLRTLDKIGMEDTRGKNN